MTIKNALNALVNKSANSRALLDSALDRSPIGSAFGAGLSTATTADAVGAAGDNLYEVITVWSAIILTENGAYEKPSGWPASSGIAGLNVGDQYYEQKRVHVSCYFNPDKAVLTQHNYLISLQAPYLGVIVNQLGAVPAGVVLHVDMHNVTGSADLVAAKLVELGV